MKKISYFLMVGLAFTALQVATVEALDDPNMPPGAPAVTGKRPGGKMGNYGCGQKNRKKHVNCLRDLLGTTPLFDKVRHRKEGNKTRGLYGCSGLKQGNWKKHTKCLRRLLDKHGPHLVGQGRKG